MCVGCLWSTQEFLIAVNCSIYLQGIKLGPLKEQEVLFMAESSVKHLQLLFDIRSAVS